MVLIEFFDTDPIENFAGFIIMKPRKVIFLGEKMNEKEFESTFCSIANKRKINTIFETRVVNKNHLPNIVEVLENLVSNLREENSDEEIVLDLCGGHDLMLVAAGIVYNKHFDIVKLQRYNIYTNTMIDCTKNIIIANQKSAISVEECTMIYGGAVVNCEYQSSGLSRWEFLPEFNNDIYKMWSICVQDGRGWNRNTAINSKKLSNIPAGVLNVKVDLRGETVEFKKNYRNFLIKLLNAGLIKNFKQINNAFSFDFKNKYIKQCLSKQGILLELFVTMTAELVEEDGRKVYDDVMMGVQIDWDGLKSESGLDVVNEIDVIAMRGLRPLYISCKNGSFGDEELHKFSAVAKQFGGQYVKKVLVTNYLSLNDNPARKSNSLQQKGESVERYRNRLRKQLLWSRAQEMDITIVCRDFIKDEKTAAETLRNIYK